MFGRLAISLSALRDNEVLQRGCLLYSCNTLYIFSSYVQQYEVGMAFSIITS